MTKKVKVIKVNRGVYVDYEQQNQIFCGVTKWDEIDENTFNKLTESIREANSYQGRKYDYFIIEQVDEYQEIFDTAKKYIDWVKKITKQQEDDGKTAKEKYAKNKLEKKLKQLAKLKKELGDN